MIKRFTWITFIISFIAITSHAKGQEPSDIEDSYNKEYYSKKFSGWKGIIFICIYNKDDKVLERICQRATSDIDLLAAATKVNIKFAKSNDFAATLYSISNGQYKSYEQYVTLEYSLIATSPSSQNEAKAIHGRLTFTKYYSNAVENNSKSGSLRNIPRPGDLELWSKELIGSGLPSDIITPFSDGAETHIKKALAMFLKYAK